MRDWRGIRVGKKKMRRDEDRKEAGKAREMIGREG